MDSNPVSRSANQASYTDEAAASVPKEPSLGKWGSFALLVNSTVLGPGLVILPAVYQMAGWLTTTTACLAVMVLSTVCAGYFIETLSMIPGNERFQSNMEYASAAKFLLGDKKIIFYIFLVILLLSLTCYSVATIVLAAQVIDFFLIAFFGKTCGLILIPSVTVMCAPMPVSTAVSPFGPAIAVSLGLVLLLAAIIPVSYLNWSGNVIVQKCCFVMFFVVLLVWMWEFVNEGLTPEAIPVIGFDQSHVLGIIVFNYSLTVILPTFVNEKKADVSVNHVLWGSAGFSTALYIFFGVFAALAYPSPGYHSLLNVLQLYPNTSLLTLLSVYVFYGIMVCQSLPLAAHIVRNNLVRNQCCGPIWADFWAILFPWMLAVPFFSNRFLIFFISWTSLLLFGLVNYIFPLGFFFIARKTFRGPQYTPSVTSPLNANSEVQGGDEEQWTNSPRLVPTRGSLSLNNSSAAETEGYRVWSKKIPDAASYGIAVGLIVLLCILFVIVIILNVFYMFLQPVRRV